MHEDAQKKAFGKEMKGAWKLAWLAKQRAWEEYKKRPGQLCSMAGSCSSEWRDCVCGSETVWEVDTIESVTEGGDFGSLIFFFFLMPIPFQEILHLIFQRVLEDIHRLQYVLEEEFYTFEFRQY